MCVLCGDPLTRIHWTQRHHSTVGGTDSNQHTRIRERLHKIRLANQILQHYGLQINDWTSHKFILSDRKGRSIILNEIGDLWPSVEKFIHFCPDPLDPLLLQSLKLDTGNGGESFDF